MYSVLAVSRMMAIGTMINLKRARRGKKHLHPLKRLGPPTVPGARCAVLGRHEEIHIPQLFVSLSLASYCLPPNGRAIQREWRPHKYGSSPLMGEETCLIPGFFSCVNTGVSGCSRPPRTQLLSGVPVVQGPQARIPRGKHLQATSPELLPVDPGQDLLKIFTEQPEVLETDPFGWKLASEMTAAAMDDTATMGLQSDATSAGPSSREVIDTAAGSAGTCIVPKIDKYGTSYLRCRERKMRCDVCSLMGEVSRRGRPKG
ncbi:hypothetical protein OBBRIDRAFT_186157 [Obba rivulosa]|uniref:Uncharacterized protein n=1 Tax=Obba rivulosa TaxID=1052685 RepID=A0A8E2AM19_9APHY|nr:hypothetical protein OBBRIDRAFT_186157 [Obba rivulosa]